MPSKVQLYAQMADRTAEQITGSYQKWTAFLTTAARLYKYPHSPTHPLPLFGPGVPLYWGI